MKKQILTTLIIYFFAQAAFAQNFLTLKGNVTEKQNQEPIAYATISIKNKAIGTVTNTEGTFVFHIPGKYINDSLVVSSIGYKSFAIKTSYLKGKTLNIQLEKKVYDLSEVDVKPKNALEIIKQAIAKIPKNYPTKPINMDGFYREMTFENDTCVEMAEAACEFYYSSYTKPFNFSKATDIFLDKTNDFNEYYWQISGLELPPSLNDKYKIIESRTSKLNHKYRFKVVPRGAGLTLTTNDEVKNKYFVLNNKMLNKYDFLLESISSYNNLQVYVVAFLGKHNKIETTGKIYIDIQSLAIVAYEYNQAGTSVWKQNNYWTPALYTKKRNRSKDIESLVYKKIFVKYKNINGIWYLDYIRKEDAFDYIFSKYYVYKNDIGKISYTTSRILTINKIKTDNLDTVGFKNATINDILYEMAFKYNPKFWKKYNVLKSTSIQDSIIKQLEIHEPLEKQYLGRFFKNDTLKPPVAPVKKMINPYTKLSDNYYWMQNVQDPELLENIEEENGYVRNYMKPLKFIERNLYFEMLKRNVRDKVTNNEKQIVGNYEYYYKTKNSQGIPNIFRKEIKKDAKEELLIDVEKNAIYDKNYWAELISVKPDNSIFAYIEPISGDYDTRTIFRDIKLGKNIDTLYNIENIIWLQNSNSFFYVKRNQHNLANRLLKHELGTNSALDSTIYHEINEGNIIQSHITDNSNYCLLESYDIYGNNEVYLINLSSNINNLKQIVKRQIKTNHRIDIIGDTLYSLSRENNNYIIYKTSINNIERKYWEKVVVNNKNEQIISVLFLNDYFVLIVGRNLLNASIDVYDKTGHFLYSIDFEKEKSYSIKFVTNKSKNKNIFQFQYTSLKTPKITYQYNLITLKLKKLSEQKVRGYIAKNYKTELFWANSNNGITIPVTIVYNKKLVKKNKKAPLYITAYGSGGMPILPEFSSLRLSLLDRGFVYAIAHVRGGSELGEKWHEDAMQLKKKNTFNDFIVCTEYLIKKKYTAKGKIIAEGGSAAGEVMGVAANWKPELFNTIILYVPSLDILNTVCDTTTYFSGMDMGEYGNPKNKIVFKYIKSYSPYNNIKAQNYPNMLLTTGLNDTRVEYWNAVKTAAKLREMKTDNNTLLLRTDLYGGHSNNGFYNYFAEKAFEYAFILNNLGIEY